MRREAGADIGALESAWRDFYSSIKPVGDSGILGSIIARCDAHTLRLAMLYTVLSDTLKIGKDQLKAAISFWQYCQRSAQWALGQQTGNKMADRILWALSNERLGMTRTEIRQEIFSRNCANIALDIALSALVNAELAYVKHEQISGARRKVERWFAGNRPAL